MNVDTIVGLVRDRGSLPASAKSASFTDQKVIDAMNAEMAMTIFPMLIMSRQGYFTDHEDQAIVSGQAQYPMPIRAVSSAAIAVKYVSTSGVELYPLEQVTPREVGRYSSNGYAQVFYLDQQGIVVTPTPTASGGSLRIYFDRRPGLLTSNLDATGTLGLTAGQTTAVGVVASAVQDGLGAMTITLTANTNGWPANTKIDIMAALSPFQIRQRDLATTTANAGTATIEAGIDLPTGANAIVAGDVVSLARTSNIPEIPLEWHDVLADLAPARISNQLGLYPQEQAIRNAVGPRMKMLLDVAEPRARQNVRLINSWASSRRRY